MKTTFVLATILSFMVWFNSYGTETEPNNTRNQANKLALNGSNTGSISPAGDVDWWKVTTNSDGALSITIISNNGQYLSFQLYDFDGTTPVNGGVGWVNTTATQITDGLASGVYFIKINASSAPDQPTYTISNSLAHPPVSNDVEPNGTYATAINLPQNSMLTGHVGYYYKLARDSVDWYKVTTTEDGQLNLTLTSNNNHYISIALYDNNGTTLLNYSDWNNVTFTLSSNSLASGTYYFRVNCTNFNDFAPYTIKDSLIAASVSNDAEPNNTALKAISINAGETKTGHVGYYYNLTRDTSDWYKITTANDGQLNLSLTTINGHYTSVYLYDHNGTTLLNNFDYNTSTATLITNGLAAGTYYFNIHCTFNNDFTPYIITPALVNATGSNDPEPNNSKSQATVLPLNGSTTGHVGYYYNLGRDTADWYSLTTDKDGELNVSLTNNDGRYLSAALFDNNGITVINHWDYITDHNVTLLIDGLKAGTYFLKINCTYYTTEFNTYTIGNTLVTYAYANDVEPNNHAAQAHTMPANGTANGHINFYYNGTFDSPDWWRINYTGDGSLKIKMNEANGLACNCQRYFSLSVYKDTLAGPIYNADYQISNLTVNLSSLTQGYYYVSVRSTFANEFFTYALADSFTQSNCVSSVAATKTYSGTTCNNSYITFQATGGMNQVYLQLYRYGVAQGSPVAVDITGSHKFSNLLPGNYYCVGYSDGGTGTCMATSATKTVMPKPTGLNATNITATTADLNWTTLSCAKFYYVQYRVQGTTKWTKKITNGNVGTYHLTKLSHPATYEYHVAANDSMNGQTAKGAYSPIATFTTPAKLESVVLNPETQEGIDVYPNPSTGNVMVTFANSADGAVTIKLFDVTGTIVFAQHQQFAEGMVQTQLELPDLNAGLYLLKIITADGSELNQSMIRIKE